MWTAKQVNRPSHLSMVSGARDAVDINPLSYPLGFFAWRVLFLFLGLNFPPVRGRILRKHPRGGDSCNMTKSERIKINELSAEGLGYRRISAVTGLSPNTIKSYLKRHGSELAILPAQTGCECKRCHRPIQQTPHKRQKVFCSDACRMAWWNAHPEKVQRRANHTLCCEQCGITFISYSNKQRRFCSRACYAEYRKKGSAKNELV